MNFESPCGLSGKAPLLLIPLILLCGCSTLHVPMTPLNFKPEEMLRANSSGLALAIKPIEGVNEYWDLFNDNLPEIGITAAWISLRNTSGDTLDLSCSKWNLQIGERRFARIGDSKVLDKYYKSRHIRMYQMSADLKARRDLETIVLHAGRLRASGKVEGLVFFQVDPSLASSWTRGSLLHISNIRGAGGKRIEVNLSLVYASPRG
ncbi:MAG TPA: hypothetical protein VE398_03745 [Acidobacteriota bacterium]|nr:hypothetical protein [Acidobacteriota bacterium]